MNENTWFLMKGNFWGFSPKIAPPKYFYFSFRLDSLCPTPSVRLLRRKAYYDNDN
jgi:hypothetical protein